MFNRIQRTAWQLIVSSHDLTFRILPYKNRVKPELLTDVIPLKWSVEVSIAEELASAFHGKVIDQLPQTSLVVWPLNSNSERLILAYADYSSEGPTPLTSSVISYDPKTKDIKLYQDDSTTLVPYILLCTRDGVLWGVGKRYLSKSPVLFRYDESADEFRVVVTEKTFSSENVRGAITRLQEDDTGQLWVLVENNREGNSIYCINPISYKLSTLTICQEWT